MSRCNLAALQAPIPSIQRHPSSSQVDAGISKSLAALKAPVNKSRPWPAYRPNAQTTPWRGVDTGDCSTCIANTIYKLSRVEAYENFIEGRRSRYVSDIRAHEAEAVHGLPPPPSRTVLPMAKAPPSANLPRAPIAMPQAKAGASPIDNVLQRPMTARERNDAPTQARSRSGSVVRAESRPPLPRIATGRMSPPRNTVGLGDRSARNVPSPVRRADSSSASPISAPSRQRSRSPERPRPATAHPTMTARSTAGSTVDTSRDPRQRRG